MLTVCELEDPSEAEGLQIENGRLMKNMCAGERVLGASTLSDALREGMRVFVALVGVRAVAFAILRRVSDGYRLEGVYAHSRYLKHGCAIVMLSVCLDGMTSDVIVHPEKTGELLFNSLGFMPTEGGGGFVLHAAATNGLLLRQTRRHPRMFFPELFELYEKIALKKSLGRTLHPQELSNIKRMLSKSGELLPQLFVEKLKEIIVELGR